MQHTQALLGGVKVVESRSKAPERRMCSERNLCTISRCLVQESSKQHHAARIACEGASAENEVERKLAPFGIVSWIHRHNSRRRVQHWKPERSQPWLKRKERSQLAWLRMRAMGSSGCGAVVSDPCLVSGITLLQQSACTRPRSQNMFAIS
jgi:hypothetical protein